MTDDPLTRLEAHLAALEAISFTDISFTGDGPLPDPPALPLHALGPHERERAQELLSRAERAADRLRGMQTRVRGELAALRRPHRDGSRPAPRAVDTSA